MALFIGKIIREIAENRGITKTELGRRLNMSSTNVHKIFKRESIDTALLQKISTVLEYDFFTFYSDGSTKNNVVPSFVLQDKPEEYKTALEQCREKVVMLEKINQLQEDKIKNLQEKK